MCRQPRAVSTSFGFPLAHACFRGLNTCRENNGSLGEFGTSQAVERVQSPQHKGPGQAGLCPLWRGSLQRLSLHQEGWSLALHPRPHHVDGLQKKADLQHRHGKEGFTQKICHTQICMAYMNDGLTRMGTLRADSEPRSFAMSCEVEDPFTSIDMKDADSRQLQNAPF